MANPSRRYSEDEIAIVEAYRRHQRETPHLPFTVKSAEQSGSTLLENGTVNQVVKALASNLDSRPAGFFTNPIAGNPQAEPRKTPFHCESVASLKKFVFATDVHGDRRIVEAVNAVLRFTEKFQPDYRICGGDVFDLRALRSGASKDEKRESMREDVRCGHEFLKQFQPTDLLWGNHDVRLFDQARLNRGPVSDYCRDVIEQTNEILSHCGTRAIEYDKYHYLNINDLIFAHGFGTGGVTAAKQHAQAYGSHVMIGHGHAIDRATVPGAPDAKVGMMVGCLCDLVMDFQRAALNTMRHAHGFGFGVFLPNGQHVAWQAHIIDGQVYAPGIDQFCSF